ncbi:hypothetical protein E2C01_052709 [Portunus trituberculatus]|uniref:Uncharacterized protein n=1 Tax=Portunus trituberculatus TaxID=210409 RepID=A0A5B7GIE2_PORTR|nr:hypothetical protein [Portunus trituberculatus]
MQEGGQRAVESLETEGWVSEDRCGAQVQSAGGERCKGDEGGERSMLGLQGGAGGKGSGKGGMEGLTTWQGGTKWPTARRGSRGC